MNVFSQKHLDEYLVMCEKQYGVTVREKKTSRLMKVLSVLLFFNKRFMTEYITTIGTTVYWPDWETVRSSRNPIGVFRTLFHEVQHASDYRDSKFWFVVSYLSPQIWALLALLSLLSFLGTLTPLAFLAFLVLLAPIPSIDRTRYELRGSSCTMAWNMWRGVGLLDEKYKERLTKRFSGPDYYFMWPLKKSFHRMLEKAKTRLINGELTQVQKDTYEFLKSYDIVR